MKNISLIISCAGKSTRFKNHPKWLNKCPNGNLMIQECIMGLDLSNVDNIYITFLKIHIDKYCKKINLEELFSFTKKNIKILFLNESNSQCETVFNTIQHFNINGPIFIKDCDNYFKFKIIEGNYICSLFIDSKTNVNKLYNKSFIEINNINKITNICEKKIISNHICIGGYSFKNSSEFLDKYNTLSNIKLKLKEYYISHIILQFILQGHIFLSYNVENYKDWGTETDWNAYIDQYRTIFINIEGILFDNDEPIAENIDIIKDLYENGKTQIILTTEKDDKSKKALLELFDKNNVKYHQIIFNLLHCKRYLINNYSNTKSYPSAFSINVETNKNLSILL